MTFSPSQWLFNKICHWLLKNEPPQHKSLSDFKQICDQIRPADVILIEGRHRVSGVIRMITRSPWTHAALYIGQLADIADITMREKIAKQYNITPGIQLLVESELGVGTTISPLSNYQNDHIRLLRPQGLPREDADKVINYALSRLGTQYDIQHILDLARLLFPWSIFPRKWRSSLFRHNIQQPTKDICSSVIADAFRSVKFPILPLIKEDEDGLGLVERNTRLFTPSDFDYSPYFAIIKYPIFSNNNGHSNEALPWRAGAVNDE